MSRSRARLLGVPKNRGGSRRRAARIGPTSRPDCSPHDPGGSRTRDLRIKSPLLYQLSYRVGVVSNFAWSNYLDNSRIKARLGEVRHARRTIDRRPASGHTDRMFRSTFFRSRSSSAPLEDRRVVPMQPARYEKRKLPHEQSAETRPRFVNVDARNQRARPDPCSTQLCGSYTFDKA